MMVLWNLVRNAWLPAFVAGVCLVASAAAQNYRSPNPANPASGEYRADTPRQIPLPPRQANPRPPYRVAERLEPAVTSTTLDLTPREPGEHPLGPAIRWAHEGLHEAEKIRDYSAVMVKRERINGKILPTEYMFIKVRHNPMSVYMCFLNPPQVKGQETIWIENQNNGKMSAHGVGLRKMFGTVSLDPHGPIAMQGNRYPITELGVLNLIRRLIEVAENDAQYGECEVNVFPGAKINGRSCTCIQVVHPVPRRNFLFHLARIFVDDELNIPIRYEAHEWPSEPGGKPILIEEYTYLDVKINQDFTDDDFNTRNPSYNFTSGVREARASK